jgi:hypothetical protein
MSPRARIEVVIDRLVVHGTSRADARTFERDLRDALERAAIQWADGTTGPPTPGRVRAVGPVDVSTEDAPGGSGSSALADRVATAVVGAVQRPGHPSGPGRGEVAS